MVLAKLVIQTLLSCVVIGLILFVSAGTMGWPGAWVLLAEIAIGSLTLGLWLSQADPGLLAERLRPPVQQGQKTWDKALLIALLVGFVAWAVIMALDAARFGWSEVPFVVRVVGAFGPIASYVITFFAFRANSFASPVVKIDDERTQRVADTGPYAIVRHPMYAGAVLFIVGTTLMLGSWAGLALAPFLVLMLASRAKAEEQMLVRELVGYPDYAQRVRFRLVPGVW